MGDSFFYQLEAAGFSRLFFILFALWHPFLHMFTLLYIMNSFNSIKVLLYEEEDAVLKNIPRFLCVRRKRLPLW